MPNAPSDRDESSNHPTHKSASHVTAAQADFAAVVGDALAALWAREASAERVMNDTRSKNLRRNSPGG